MTEKFLIKGTKTSFKKFKKFLINNGNIIKKQTVEINKIQIKLNYHKTKLLLIYKNDIVELLKNTYIWGLMNII